MANASGATGKLRIETVGRLRLILDGRELRISSRKAMAILGYLILNDTPTATREQLVGLLWSEADEERARGSLRHCVKELRIAYRGTDFTGITLANRIIALDPAKVDVDLWQVLAEAKAGRVHNLLLDVVGLMEHVIVDLESVDPVFAAWVSAKRRSINERLLRNLEDALRALPVEDVRCEELARAIINLDSTHEEACRTLMASRAHHGDIGGALKVYTALYNVLGEVHDVEPTDMTQALFAELKGQLPLSGGGDAAVALAPAPAAMTAPPSVQARSGSTRLVISISPFDAGSIAPERRYLVNGFRAELIAYLTRFREWIVREQRSGVQQDPLPGEYLLSAEIMPLRRGARLWLQLRESADDGYLWGDGIDLETVDWGETQQSLVRRIAAALNIHISAGRLAEMGPRPSSDVLAYDMWLRGQSHLLTVQAKAYEAAESIYRDIVARYPNFAPAYSSLAQIYNSEHFAYPGRFRAPKATADALKYANAAVRLDPMDSRSQLSLGWANAMAGLHDLAAIHHDLAVELNGSDPWTLVSSALGSAFRQSDETARRLADRAGAVSTAASGIQWRYQAMIRYLIGDLPGCVEAAGKAEHSIQNVLVWKAAALVELGDGDQASKAVDRFFDIAKDRWQNAELAPSRQNIARWFLHAFPFKSQVAWERLRDGFGRAGAPIEGLEFKELCVQPSQAHSD